MSLRNAARYSFGLVIARIMPLNDDNTIPVPDRIIGGAGPFDFSDAPAPAAIPMSFKFDNGTVETISIDLSGAGDITAVTAQEVVDAINAETPTEILASLEAVTLRVELSYTGTDNPDILQVYGLAAELCFIGQGYGVQFRKSDTLKTLSDAPVNKDEETITTTDGNGLDTEVITDGYRKGFESKLVDSADALDIREIIEGGVYDPVAGTYELPTAESVKPYFYLEFFYRHYREGTNKEADLVGYVRKLYRNCKGMVGDVNHGREFADFNYTIKGTAYTDENGVTHADSQTTNLTVPQFEALNVETV